MRTVLVFGNLLKKEDNIALKLIPGLKKEFPEIEFREADPTEDIQKYGKDLRILDVALDIKKVKLLKLSTPEDFKKLQTGKIYSMHDFDLGYNLKLLKKMDLIDSVEIICIPARMEERQAFEGVSKILRDIS
jgi:Ni,Fe-hydrogenase maturation factor